MKTVLYGLTAVIIGLHTVYWLMSGIYGVPINPWYAAPLLGSVLLMLTAIIPRVRPRIAASVGLAGSLLSWVAYGLSLSQLPVRLFRLPIKFGS